MADYLQQLYANKMDNLEEMDKFWERYNLLRLNQEETENMNRPITSTEIETVIKKLPTNVQDHMNGEFFTGKFYQTFGEELTPSLLKLSPKICRGRNTPNTIIMIPKPDKDTTKKEKYWPVSPVNINAEVIQKIVANRIQQYIKRTTLSLSL